MKVELFSVGGWTLSASPHPHKDHKLQFKLETYTIVEYPIWTFQKDSPSTPAYDFPERVPLRIKSLVRAFMYVFEFVEDLEGKRDLLEERREFIDSLESFEWLHYGRTPDAPLAGEFASYGRFDRSSKGSYVELPLCTWGDYVGSTVERANYLWLEENFEDLLVKVLAAYSTHSLFIRKEDLLFGDERVEELRDAISGLESYPLFEDEYMSNLEEEILNESFEWRRSDFEDVLAARWGWDQVASISKEKVEEIFYEWISYIHNVGEFVFESAIDYWPIGKTSEGDATFEEFVSQWDGKLWNGEEIFPSYF